MIEIQATLDFLDIMLIVELLFAVRPCDDCTRTKPLVDHGGHILGATVGRTFETTLTDAGPCGSVHGTQRATLGVFRGEFVLSMVKFFIVVPYAKIMKINFIRTPFFMDLAIL